MGNKRGATLVSIQDMIAHYLCDDGSKCTADSIIRHDQYVLAKRRIASMAHGGFYDAAAKGLEFVPEVESRIG